jgi:hypothetical protein
MKSYERKREKDKKKEAKKRLQTGEWSVPDKIKSEEFEVVPKIPRFNWADEA